MSDANLPLVTWSPRQTIAATLVVGAVCLGFLLLYLMQSVLFLLFVGVVVATALKPLIALFERLNLSHGTAVTVVYMTLGGLLLIAVVAGLPLIVDQLTAMVDQLPKYYEALRKELLKLPGDLLQRLVGQLPAQIFTTGEVAEADPPALNAVTQALSYGEPVLQGTVAAVAVLLFAFYWSLQEERSTRALLMLAPPAKRNQVRELFESMQSKVGAYLRGQGILCLVVGAMNFLAFLMIGLPYAVTLGIVAGVCEAVPMFGPVLGALPAALVALSVDPSKAIWVLVAAVVIQQTENYLLVPRVMDRSVGVNPVVTLLAIAGFGSILGFAGAILAIPLAAILQVLLTRFLLSSQALEPAPVIGRDAASLIRYQAREIVHDVRLQSRHTTDDDDEADLIQEELEAIARDLDRSLPEPAETVTASNNGNLPSEASPVKRLALHTAIVLATLTVLLILWQLRGVILMFFLSLATAAALRPLIQRLVDQGLPKSLALVVTYLALFVTVTGILLLLAPPLANELQLIGDDFVHAYDRITTEWPKGSQMEVAVARRLPPPRELFASFVGSTEASVVQTVLGATVGFFGILVHVIVVVVLSIYWSIDRVHFERLWLSLLAVDTRTEARDVWRSIEVEVGAYLRSEVVQSLAAGVLLGLGFWLIGLPYPILLGIVGALAWFVPWVGMLLSVTAIGVLSLPTLVLRPEPAALLIFLSGAAYTMLVLMLLELFIEPRLFNRRRYNSLLIVIVVLSLAELVGVVGVVLGPPLAAAIQILMGHLLRRRATATVTDGAGPARSLAVRANEIRSRIELLPEPPPELLSLSERLNKLIAEAENLGPATGRYSTAEPVLDSSPTG